MPNELAKAKILVMAKVPYIQKERKQGLTYTFAGEAAILEKLHPAFREAGLSWAVTGCTLIAQEQYSTKSGAAMNRVIVQATYTLTHAESGQSETVQALGEGSDHGDKATSKAMTSALKYALRQTFLIETGDDPDNTPSDQQERGNHASKPQQARPHTVTQPPHQQRKPLWEDDDAFFQKLQQSGRAWVKVVQWLNEKHGGKYKPDSGFWDVSVEHRKIAADAMMGGAAK